MADTFIENVYKFCPKCGQPNPQCGKVPFRCGACDFVNFFGPVTAVGGLVVDHETKLLLVQRAREPGKGLWGLPGGFVDRNESVEDALKREVYEETHLDLESISFLMSHPNEYHYGGIIVTVTDLFFVCRAKHTDQIKLQKSELSHHRWVNGNSSLFEKMAFASNALAVRRWANQNNASC